ncbi:UbiA family prenyltransferase [Streptomyces sp. TRM70308]|uniref:UbiA family prenyltransferase n=1 Tax=Streptomyces sp. TRM70308 TaxID=3131932 RepID=UPI003D02DAA0
MAQAAAVPPAKASKTRALINAGRISTRVWFDVLAPLATLLVVSGGRPDWGPALLVIVMLVLFHAGQTYYNDIADVEVDRTSSEADRNQRVLVTQQTTRRDMAVLGTALIAASLVCAAFVSWQVLALLAVTTLLVLGYNFEPVRFAGRPLATQIFWPLMWGSIYWMSTAATGDEHWKPGLWFLAFVVVFMGLGESITQDTRDADNDADGGRRTTVVVFGLGPTTVFALATHVLSLAPLAIFGIVYPLPIWATVAAMAAVAVWLYYFFRAWRVLRNSFEKDSARLTHVGSIYAFTAVNVIVCAGVFLGAR